MVVVVGTFGGGVVCGGGGIAPFGRGLNAVGAPPCCANAGRAAAAAPNAGRAAAPNASFAPTAGVAPKVKLKAGGAAVAPNAIGAAPSVGASAATEGAFSPKWKLAEVPNAERDAAGGNAAFTLSGQLT